MEIIKFTRTMASSVSHIYAHSWKSAYQNIIPQKYLNDLSLERWTPLLENSPYTSFVVKVSGEFVATSSISSARDMKMKGWGEIISIYVLPQHFGKGYGKVLIDFVISQLHHSGFDNIYLWVLEDNKKAIKFYEKNGFIANGEQAIINIGGKDLVEVCYIYRKK